MGGKHVGVAQNAEAGVTQAIILSAATEASPDTFVTIPGPQTAKYQRRRVFATWLWLQKPVPKWNPGKWKHGPKPWSWGKLLCESQNSCNSLTHILGP